MAIETVYLAGGCYWGFEDLLSKIPGVVDTTVGFSGGHVKNVCYREVTTGTTGHAETVKVVFDSDILSFKDLLLFFFKIHDPTTLNQQGNDIGTQYRSAIFATNNAVSVAIGRLTAHFNLLVELSIPKSALPI